jgi:hypothetical protein
MLGLPILLWDERLTTFAAEEASTGFNRCCGRSGPAAVTREQGAHRLGPIMPKARRREQPDAAARDMLGLPILLWDERLTTFVAEAPRTGFTRSCGLFISCGRHLEQGAHRLCPILPEARRRDQPDARQETQTGCTRSCGRRHLRPTPGSRARTGLTDSCGQVVALPDTRDQGAHRLCPTSPDARGLALTSRREPAGSPGQR